MYTLKYPGTPWEEVGRRRRWRSRRRAEQYIETAYAPGYTRQPYVQLVEITRDGMRVVAEWDVARREWVQWPPPERIIAWAQRLAGGAS